MTMRLGEFSKKVGISIPTLRKWIYRNEEFLKKNRIVLILNNKKRKTIKILQPKRFEEIFFKGGEE